MVDTVKCQSEADLTEPFFRKLLLGAIDKTIDQQETIAGPSPYNNYTHHPKQLTRRATAGGGQQQQNNRYSKGINLDIDQRPTESSFHHTSDPEIATLDHPHSIRNPPDQKPRFFVEPSLGQTSEQQQPFREPHRPFLEQPFPHSPNNLGKSPGHRRSLFGLNKR